MLFIFSLYPPTTYTPHRHPLAAEKKGGQKQQDDKKTTAIAALDFLGVFLK